MNLIKTLDDWYQAGNFRNIVEWSRKPGVDGALGKGELAALVWLAKAELAWGNGERFQAAEFATKALDVNPRDRRAQTIIARASAEARRPGPAWTPTPPPPTPPPMDPANLPRVPDNTYPDI